MDDQHTARAAVHLSWVVRCARALFASQLLIPPTSATAQLQLNGSMTPQELVQNVLLGQGVTVSNVTYNGQPGNVPFESIGRFDGSACVLGIDSGVVMCTGGIDVALGPNNSGSYHVDLLNATPPDDDLDNVAADFCMDVASLEFDFVPQGDSITFSYSFASEEYLEYVNAGYNDAFGFFLSGPGIFGPFLNDAVDLAVVPGTFSYVSVNSINTGSNSAYYQDNGSGANAPFNSDPYYFQFDGFTVGLRAGAAVQCGQTYHIKMAIGDVGDPNWDSGVFIQGGTFSSHVGLSITAVTPDGAGPITESCGNVLVTITRSATSGGLDVPLTTSGSAVAPSDYDGIPSSVTIPDGQASVSFTVHIANDYVNEGNEDLTVTALYSGGCSGVNISTTVTIQDHAPIVISDQTINTPCSNEPLTIIANATGGVGELAYAWNQGGSDAQIDVPGHSGSYSVSVSDVCGATAHAMIQVFAPCEIIIPNVFSPNGDGVNDLFTIEGIEGTRNTVHVYNRWGQLVFEASNYLNTWDARTLSDGTYYYVVQVDGYDQPFTGHVTILANRS